MNYKQLISDAWGNTQKEKGLIIWFGFLPSLLTTTFGIFYVGYQIMAFKKSHLFEDADSSFLYDVAFAIWSFINTHMSWTLPLVLVLAFLAAMWFLFPTLAHAGAIQAIARRRNGHESGVGTGLKFGISSYLPLFEYHILIKTFSFISILAEMAFVVRNLPMVIFQILFPIMLFVMIVGLVLTLLFIYADFFIVIDGDGIFKSMQKSARLVFMHWKHTFLIAVLMILIGIRIVVQVIVVFLIPFLVIVVTGYLATVILPSTGIIIGAIVGGIIVIISAYLNGIVDIFSYTVWTYTFLEITSEKEISAREILVDDIGDNPKANVEHKNLDKEEEKEEDDGNNEDS